MSEGRRYAILIGSSRFDNEPKLHPLKSPERDVDGMLEILRAPELGAFGETFAFKNIESHAVLRRIEEVLAEASGNDQVLIYYSGHGETDLPGLLYLATANTEKRTLVTTSIPVETLRTLIDKSSCRNIILILDCCYGGAAGKSFSRGTEDENLKGLARGSGVYILTASTASQTAQEREGDDYGLLTKHIIAGIKLGDADVNQDGFVSMDDLYGYVFAKVKSEGYQEPMRWALNVKGEDLIIARATGTQSLEKQRLKEMVMEYRGVLPPQVFRKASEVIDERQPPFYGLVQELFHRRLQIGEFIEEWYRIESVDGRQLPNPAPLQPAPKPAAPAKIEVVEFPPEAETTPLTPERLSQVRQPPPLELSSTMTTSASGRKPRPRGLPYIYSKLEMGSSNGMAHRRKLIVFGILLFASLMAFGVLQVLKKTPGSPDKEHVKQEVPPKLASGSFVTVILDAKGKDKFHRTLNADYFPEDIGGGVALDMVKIRSGEFLMGSPKNEAQRESNESPQHKVEVSEFHIGRFEVTREQWRQVATLPTVDIDLEEDPANFKDSWRQPVEQVSWREAVEFCKRLQQKTRKTYRLPTEAEWEYAARAGSTSPFAFGPTITPAIVNYEGNHPYGSAPTGRYRNKAVEVGSLGFANAFGLYDMHGNVWEWCEDVYHDSYGGQNGAPPSDGSAWITGGVQGTRVLRGGSWSAYGYVCRSAYRFRTDAGSRGYKIGFRVVSTARTP